MSTITAPTASAARALVIAITFTFVCGCGSDGQDPSLDEHPNADVDVSPDESSQDEADATPAAPGPNDGCVEDDPNTPVDEDSCTLGTCKFDSCWPGPVPECQPGAPDACPEDHICSGMRCLRTCTPDNPATLTVNEDTCEEGTSCEGNVCRESTKVPAGELSTLPAEALTVNVTKIGEPRWEAVGFQLFAAPLGIASDSGQTFISTLRCLYPSPDHELDLQLQMFVPGEAHASPYDTEPAEGVTRCGWSSRKTFTAAELAPPIGIYLSYVLVPGADAVQGASPDFDEGPVLDHALFPLLIDGDLLKGSAVVDGDFDSQYPALTATSTAGDGYSHAAHIFGSNMSYFVFGGPVVGAYTYRIKLVDAEGHGYTIEVPFTVQ